MWFYASGEEKKGPISKEELLRLVMEGAIESDCLVWTEGMEGWQQARDVDGLLPKGLVPPPLPKPKSVSSSAPTSAVGHEISGQISGDRSGPKARTLKEGEKSLGIGRLYYFVAALFLALIMAFTDLAFDSAEPSRGSAYVLFVVPLLIEAGRIAIGWSRFKNIGIPPAFSLLGLIPLINLIIGAACLALPENYAKHKTLDTAGKIVYGVIILSGVLLIMSLAIPHMSG